MITYLSTKPTEQAVKWQRDEAKRKLEFLAKRRPVDRKDVAAFEKQHDIPKLRSQVKTLDYLLA